MGQYYIPVISQSLAIESFISDISAWFYSHDYDQGLKMMEHSYLDNPMMRVVEEHLLHGARVAWAGDYAPATEPFAGSTVNLYELCESSDYEPFRVARGTDLKGRKRSYRFIINWDTHQLIDTWEIPADLYGFKIHPLPLLTAEGVNGSGGDYRGAAEHQLGIWARHAISCGDHVRPAAAEFDLFVPRFVEARV